MKSEIFTLWSDTLYTIKHHLSPSPGIWITRGRKRRGGGGRLKMRRGGGASVNGMKRTDSDAIWRRRSCDGSERLKLTLGRYEEAEQDTERERERDREKERERERS